MLLSVLFIIAGFALLIKGADWLVEGGSSLARRLGISELVIGLTVVSFGTSAPELIVNIVASFQESADIAVGNIVGSNISNTLLIVGTAAVIMPLTVQRNTVLQQIPFGILATVMLFALANDALIDGYDSSLLSRGDGIAFMGFFIIFLYYSFSMKRSSREERTKPKRSLGMAWFLLVTGCIGLGIGGDLAVRGSRAIAIDLGVSEALVGLTIVALGTSLPELAASAVAAYKGRSDIAIGNIVGSNIFNIFWILGLSAVIKPLPFRQGINLDLGVVVASMALLFFVIHNGHVHHRVFLWWKQREKNFTIRRFEGAILLVCYATYIGFIIWRDVGMNGLL